MARDRTELRGVRAGRDHRQPRTSAGAWCCKNPAQGAFYGTIGQLDDTGRANYHGMLLSAQRRLKGGLSALVNYTLSKCMSDPATTEITGPTITDPTNPDLDYSYCDSDRRHVLNVSLVARTPSFSNAVVNAVLGDWQVAPLVRWQSGSPFSVTTGVDNALSGMGGQRAVQMLDDPYGDGTVNNYLNPRRVHLAGGRHLQHAQAERVRQAVAASERSGGEQDVQGRRRGPCSSAGRCSTC